MRGFDGASATFIAGKTGWIILDPLTATGTAKAILASTGLGPFRLRGGPSQGVRRAELNHRACGRHPATKLITKITKLAKAS